MLIQDDSNSGLSSSWSWPLIRDYLPSGPGVGLGECYVHINHPTYTINDISMFRLIGICLVIYSCIWTHAFINTYVYLFVCVFNILYILCVYVYLCIYLCAHFSKRICSNNFIHISLLRMYSHPSPSSALPHWWLPFFARITVVQRALLEFRTIFHWVRCTHVSVGSTVISDVCDLCKYTIW